MIYNELLRQKRNVVFYARVSTEHEAQISALENQIDWYKPIMEAHSEWTLVGQYVDEGITGTSAEKRPQFMQMIADAKTHKFDMIITREVSRFARNTVDTLMYTRQLRSIGVEVFFLNDNIKTFDGDGELRLTIMASLSQDESRKTSIRVKSGQQTSMNNGVFYGNGNILGYDRVGKELIKNPEQAAIVRLIYDMYLDGYGLQKIKFELEKRHIRTSTGKASWHPTVISGILKNSFYCGIITYHKEYVPDYLEQKKIKNHGEMELTQTQGTQEPIVTVEEYERVQHIMERKRIRIEGDKIKVVGKKEHISVWSDLLICSCGNRFYRTKYTGKGDKAKYAYQCYSVRNQGSVQTRTNKGLDTEGVCTVKLVPEWKLQMMVKYIFARFLCQKQKVLDIANSMLEAHIGDKEETTDNSELIRIKTDELNKWQKKLDNLIDMRTDEDLSKEVFRTKYEEVNSRIEQLKTEIQDLTPIDVETDIPDYDAKINVLRFALEQYTDFDAERDIPDCVIEAFIESVTVYPDYLSWKLRLDPDNSPFSCNVIGRKGKSSQIVTFEPSNTLDGSTLHRQH